MISDELLYEVLDERPQDIKEVEFDSNQNELIMWRGQDAKGYYNGEPINIYELAHKCKEWAIKDGKYILHSAIVWNDSAVCIVNLGTEIQERFYADTESEAIFQACEWILNDRR